MAVFFEEFPAGRGEAGTDLGLEPGQLFGAGDVGAGVRWGGCARHFWLSKSAYEIGKSCWK